MHLALGLTIFVLSWENQTDKMLMTREMAPAAPGGRTASIAKMYIFALAGDLP